jgi:hypothetical protein
MRAAITIERLDGGSLGLDGWGLASTFFTADPSSIGTGSYDSLCGKTRADRIEISDIEALNRTIRARTAHGHWASITNTGPPQRVPGPLRRLAGNPSPRLGKLGARLRPGFDAFSRRLPPPRELRRRRHRSRERVQTEWRLRTRQ